MAQNSKCLANYMYERFLLGWICKNYWSCHYFLGNIINSQDVGTYESLSKILLTEIFGTSDVVNNYSELQKFVFLDSEFIVSSSAFHCHSLTLLKLTLRNNFWEHYPVTSRPTRGKWTHWNNTLFISPYSSAQ